MYLNWNKYVIKLCILVNRKNVYLFITQNPISFGKKEIVQEAGFEQTIFQLQVLNSAVEPSSFKNSEVLYRSHI